jgi:hypothetical protein
MAAQADLIDGTLNLQESQGIVTSITRRYLVTGLSDTDFTVLYSAITDAGVPTFETALPGYTNLEVIGRSAVPVPNSTTMCYVDVEYGIVASEGHNYTFTMDGTVSNLTTPVDRFGLPIVVQHTYSTDDEQFPGLTESQGGNINVMDPSLVMTATGIETTNRPLEIVRRWIGQLNASAWAGFPALTWLCTNVKAVPMDASSQENQWQLTFSFQLNKFGWTPYAVFIDQRTGRPPANVVSGVGYVPVSWYPQLNYGHKFRG